MPGTLRRRNWRTSSERIDAFHRNAEPIDGAQRCLMSRAALASASIREPHHSHFSLLDIDDHMKRLRDLDDESEAFRAAGDFEIF